MWCFRRVKNSHGVSVGYIVLCQNVDILVWCGLRVKNSPGVGYRVVQECEYFGVVWCGVCGVLCAVRGGGSTGGVMQESDAVSITAWPLVKNYLAADGRVVQECKEWIAVSCRKTRCVLCVVC